jgi:hypothetical protein
MLDAANRNTKKLKKTANCRLPSFAAWIKCSRIQIGILQDSSTGARCDVFQLAD